jgi:hypothetical protein
VVEIDLVGPELGSFDAIICMGNTFGVATRAGDAARAARADAQRPGA